MTKMKNPLTTSVSFDQAKDVLCIMFKDANLLPDSILATCDKLGIEYQFKRIPHWSEHEYDLDRYDQLELFDMMFAHKQMPTGSVLIVTDECFSSKQVLCGLALDLRKIVEELDSFIFDSDIIFLFPEAHCLSIFHHEGGFAHIDW